MQLDLLVKTWPKALRNGKGIFMLVLAQFSDGASDHISLPTTPSIKMQI